MILTHLWPWNKVNVIKSGMSWLTPRKVVIMQSLKKLSWAMSVKKQTLKFLWDQERRQLSPLTMCESQK